MSVRNSFVLPKEINVNIKIKGNKYSLTERREKKKRNGTR
jgi:hypothetical protein